MTQTCQVCLAQSVTPGVIAEGEWRSAGLVWPLAALQPRLISTALQTTQSAAPHVGDKGCISVSEAFLTSSFLLPQGASSLCTCRTMRLSA